jgi:subtilisin family serine protease
VRWIYAKNDDQTPTDENGHGSCVASKAVGVTYGIAKNANVVIVKLGATFGISNIIWALQLIINDVGTLGLNGQAVINMSLGGRLPLRPFKRCNLDNWD